MCDTFLLGASWIAQKTDAIHLEVFDFLLGVIIETYNNMHTSGHPTLAFPSILAPAYPWILGLGFWTLPIVFAHVFFLPH